MLSWGATSAVLLSRSGKVAREGQGLHALMQALLHSHPAAVKMYRADVANVADVKAAAGIGGLMSGWLHLADVLRPRQIHDLTATCLAQDVGPKAMGAYWLHICSHFQAPDFHVTTSSVASFGGTSTAAYSSANSYVNAFACWCSTAGSLSTAVLLPILLGVGVGVATYAEQLASPMSAVRAIAITVSQVEHFLPGIMSKSAGTLAIPLSSRNSVPRNGMLHVVVGVNVM